MQVDTNFLCASVNGKFIGNDGNIQINGVATDSRYINAGTLFFALKGEKYDGHDFVIAALKKGAAAAVISRKIDGLSEQCDSKCIIMVEDTLQALQDFARAYRLKFDIPVVAVTGSVGKTTTRDIIACCLQTVTKTLQTEANYNNDIGLPLTILKLEETHQAAVVELGMRGPGEIQRLALIAKPTCAVITNVEPVHLETLRSIENIARAKCEVLGEITEGGFAVINGDNNLLLQIADKYPCRKYTFGYNEVCDFQILKVATQNGGIVITAKLVDHMEEFYFPVPTVKLAENVIAAVAIVTLLGISVEKIRAGLLNYKGSHNRLHSIHLNNGGIIIDDTYNANPISMAAALATGRQMAGANKFIAVLGDMYELGEYETRGHVEVGKKAVETGVDLLLTVGNRARYISAGAIAAGMDKGKVHHFAVKDEALEYLEQNINNNDTVLFKASRGMRFETLVDNLKQKYL